MFMQFTSNIGLWQFYGSVSHSLSFILSVCVRQQWALRIKGIDRMAHSHRFQAGQTIFSVVRATETDYG